MHTIYVAIRSQQTFDGKQVEIPAFYGGRFKHSTYCGYALLSEILEQTLSVQYRADEIAQQSGGKPYNSAGKYCFSYAHSEELIMCAVGTQNMGVDVEITRDIDARMFPKILSQTDRDDCVEPLTAWVIKEAYAKYTGQGLAAGFANLSVRDLLAELPNEVSVGAAYTSVIFFANRDTVINTVEPLY